MSDADKGFIWFSVRPGTDDNGDEVMLAVPLPDPMREAGVINEHATIDDAVAWVKQRSATELGPGDVVLYQTTGVVVTLKPVVER